MLTKMMKAGMNVARLNFSHGTHPDHKRLIRHVRSASKKAGQTVAVLQDLQGPKIRTGKLPNEGVNIHARERISFKTGIADYESSGPFPVTYDLLHKDLKAGHRILMDDGKMEAVVKGVRGRVISAVVVTGGVLKSHKGMNLPDSTVSASSFTEKDRADLLFGLEQGVDWVALSFVTGPDVVRRVRKLMQTRCRKLKKAVPKIIVKIERPEAVSGFLAILNVADGVMVARGDLGIEIPFAEVPIFQKECVELCRRAGKPVIVATQMLESMTSNPRSTRAETSDVANAVIDHADGVMLSGETATGDYPLETVKAMAEVIRVTEEARLDDVGFYDLHGATDAMSVIAQSLYILGHNKHVDLIVTAAGYDVAKYVGVFRPDVPVVIACADAGVARKMMFRRGVMPVVLADDVGTFVQRAERYLRKKKMISSKSSVAYVLGGKGREIQLVVR